MTVIPLRHRVTWNRALAVALWSIVSAASAGAVDSAAQNTPDMADDNGLQTAMLRLEVADQHQLRAATADAADASASQLWENSTAAPQSRWTAPAPAAAQSTPLEWVDRKASAADDSAEMTNGIALGNPELGSLLLLGLGLAGLTLMRRREPDADASAERRASQYGVERSVKKEQDANVANLTKV